MNDRLVDVTLAQRIELLRTTRERLAEAQRDEASARGALEGTKEYQEHAAAKGNTAMLRDTVTIMEAGVRELALQSHAATGNRTPAAGVEIKMRRVVVYDEPRAVEWARGYAPAMLVLDRKAFEKAALANAGGAVSMPAEVLQEPAAYIATNLAAAIGLAPAEQLESVAPLAA